jgi:hypothetical protein
LNWGKWNTFLDFRKEEDREKMKALVLEADVVISGYRPGVLDKWGFGQEDILKLCEGRERGIIYARENCYGWNGPWAYRSGWQQISDAVWFLVPESERELMKCSVVGFQWSLVEQWGMRKLLRQFFPIQITAQAYQESLQFSLRLSNKRTKEAHTPLTSP